MKVTEYELLFHDIIGNGHINSGILLTGVGLLEYEKFSLLNYCGYLYQVMFNKDIIFVKSLNVNADGETPCICCADSARNFVLGKNPNQAFVIDVNFPYFDKEHSWEMKFIESLIYYRMPFIGFGTEQIIKLYE